MRGPVGLGAAGRRRSVDLDRRSLRELARKRSHAGNLVPRQSEAEPHQSEAEPHWIVDRQFGGRPGAGRRQYEGFAVMRRVLGRIWRRLYVLVPSPPGPPFPAPLTGRYQPRLRTSPYATPRLLARHRVLAGEPSAAAGPPRRRALLTSSPDSAAD